MELRDVIRRTCDRQGAVVIPTFAVGRAQVLLLLIARLKESGEIPDVRVYLDSPMAIDATELLFEFAAEHRLSRADAAAIGRSATLVRTVEESKALDGACDADELIAWLRRLGIAPRQVFVTHGEARASDTLRSRTQNELGWNVSVPEFRDEVEL